MRVVKHVSTHADVIITTHHKIWCNYSHSDGADTNVYTAVNEIKLGTYTSANVRPDANVVSASFTR